MIGVSRIATDRDLTYRKNLLIKLQDCILKNRQSIAKALKSDLGKSSYESQLSEIGYVLEDIKHALKNLKLWMTPKSVSTPSFLIPAKSEIHFEPFGKVLIIAPWNYPFQLLFSPLVGALASGNQVVLKPSEVAPATEQILTQMIQQNFDEKDIRIVTGGADVTQKLLAEKWDFIFYTGNSSVGKIVAKAAAEKLTPTCLELGGKSPCIVESDADIDTAVKRIAWGKFFNAGQTCVAPDYLLVHESVYEVFISKLKAVIEVFYQDGIQSENFGKIINEKHFDRLLKLFESSSVLFGGKFDRGLLKIQPTLIAGDLKHSSMQEEIFGPILPIFKFSKSEEALRMIEGFEKPLALYIFSKNVSLQNLYLNSISFGGGCANDCILQLANPNLPFGGVGNSGMGSYHGRFSFETFSHKKSLLKRSSAFDIDFRYPPYKEKFKTWARFFLKLK